MNKNIQGKFFGKFVCCDGVDLVLCLCVCCCVVQVIYVWQIFGGNVQLLIVQFVYEQVCEIVDLVYFEVLLYGVFDNCCDIDEVFGLYLDCGIEEVDVIECVVLCLVVYELCYCLDVLYCVVINEVIELVKCFGFEYGYIYVNGVLDCVVVEWCKVELGY